jgi:hypothetical protein
MWLMYKTPFKVVEWAFNVHLPGRGGFTGLAKAAATLAIAIPVKSAVAAMAKNAVAAGGAAAGAASAGAAERGAAETAAGGAPAGARRDPILKGTGGGIKIAKAHDVKQARDHMRGYEQQRSAQETIQRYLGDRDPGGATQKPRFMTGGPTGKRGSAGDRGPLGGTSRPVSRDPNRV